MAVRIGINGFGRIGRCVFRSAYDNSQIDFVAINDITDPKTLAHLLKYDSVHGTFGADVKAVEDAIVVNGKNIRIFQEKDPEKIPWKDMGVDIVLECSGLFTSKEKAEKHLKAGAKKVIISAPANDADITICMGINHTLYEPSRHHVISNASCTTNCLAPVAKVLHEKFGILRGIMTTVHSYTNDQRILDLPHKDLRRARAAALSMIPTTTGAAKAVGLVLPELKGKLDGISVRVPTPNVSLVDLTAELSRAVTKEEVNQAMLEASRGPLQGILYYVDEPLVSSDFNHTPYSSIFDSLSTMVVGEKLVKVLAWYDNEWGFSNRMKDLALFIATHKWD
jgi:glyceraldehyde 3-phosphate dehydrogenase